MDILSLDDDVDVAGDDDRHLGLTDDSGEAVGRRETQRLPPVLDLEGKLLVLLVSASRRVVNHHWSSGADFVQFGRVRKSHPSCQSLVELSYPGFLYCLLFEFVNRVSWSKNRVSWFLKVKMFETKLLARQF